MQRELRTRQRARGARRRLAQRGYTLVELMVIVMIIGISVVVFTPGFGRAMADRRLSSAARELIRIGRRARADSSGYLRAHLVWVDPVVRRVQLLRGPTNSCSLTEPLWQSIQSDCPSDPTLPPGRRCLENLYLSTLGSPSQPIGLFEEASDKGLSNGSGRAFCYGPNGKQSFASGATLAGVGAWTDDNPMSLGGGFVYALATGLEPPTESNLQRMHRVLFPLGGSARALR